MHVSHLKCLLKKLGINNKKIYFLNFSTASFTFRIQRTVLGLKRLGSWMGWGGTVEQNMVPL